MGRVLALDLRRGRRPTSPPRPCRPRCARPGATGSTGSSRSAGDRAPTRPRPCASSPSRSRAPPARPSPIARRCPTSPSPPTYSGAELTGFFGMTDPNTRAKERGRRTHHRPDGRALRPQPHPLAAGPHQRRDGHERPGPLRRGGLVADRAPPRPRRWPWPVWPASSTPCPGWSTSPATSRPASDMLTGSILAGRVPAERVDGHPPRPGPAGGRAHRHPPRPGQRHHPGGGHALQRRGRARGHGPHGPGPRRADDAAGARWGPWSSGSACHHAVARWG